MPQAAPLVSIVTPAYNAAAHFAETAASVLQQTFENWEWIVVDDGSTDATAAMVEEIADPRVRLIRMTHSGLPACARNRGVAAARGAFVAFIDADDIWLPRKLELQLQVLQEHPGVGLVFSRYFWYWTGAVTRKRSTPEPDLRGLPNPGFLFGRLALENAICASSVVVRRAVAEAFGPMDEDPRQRGTEDYEYWLRLAPTVRFAFVGEPLVLYRIQAQGVSRRAVPIAEGSILALEKALARLRPEEVPAELRAGGFEARALFRRGKAQVRDGVDGALRTLWSSVRLRPGRMEVWAWLALSLLGRRLGPTVVRLAERVL
jgi:glycosyltransferase involved in cell wall biosynthesis